MKSRTKEAVNLLQSLIRSESFSGHEEATADTIASFLKKHGIKIKRIENNIIATNAHYDNRHQTIVLNSHHDTVKVVNGWTYDPFGAVVENGRLYGLGANDAGASLVSLISSFIYYYQKEIPFNLVLIASAEEENFGPKGVALVLDQLDMPIDLGIVGEPTGMHLAVAEKGLIVIDAYAKGVAGHAARDLGTNAIYKALEDIDRLKDMTFKKKSDVLGPVKVTVTQIEAGHQHNVIPDSCHFVIDVRVNECYTNTEILTTLQDTCQSELVPRSLRWSSSGIAASHPVVRRGEALGRKLFGSPTLSDQVHFSCPTLKIGPGESTRSHTANEYIKLEEIEEGIDLYIALLDQIIL